jgi:hypothetical protein
MQPTLQNYRNTWYGTIRCPGTQSTPFPFSHILAQLWPAVRKVDLPPDHYLIGFSTDPKSNLIEENHLSDLNESVTQNSYFETLAIR